jgi:acid phosphatase
MLIGKYSWEQVRIRDQDIWANKQSLSNTSLKFLPEEWDDKSFYLRSTDYNRTQESLQQLVAGGLYPPEKRDEKFQLKIRTRYDDITAKKSETSVIDHR